MGVVEVERGVVGLNWFVLGEGVKRVSGCRMGCGGDWLWDGLWRRVLVFVCVEEEEGGSGYTVVVNITGFRDEAIKTGF